MADQKNIFTDAADYDRSMGRMSRIAGEKFLDWLSMPEGLRWLDIGCGTGSFTELVFDRLSPASIAAIDPSEHQIAFARTKPVADRIGFRQGDAMSLEFDDNEFDVAVMALVIQYIPDPEKAMGEIVRVVRPGGTVAAYVWPAHGDGHPSEYLRSAVRSVGPSETNRPGAGMRTTEAMKALFAASGITEIETRSLEIPFRFENFEKYWAGQHLDQYRHLGASEIAQMQEYLSTHLPRDAEGRISYTARANAIRGRVAD